MIVNVLIAEVTCDFQPEYEVLGVFTDDADHLIEQQWNLYMRDEGTQELLSECNARIEKNLYRLELDQLYYT